MFLYNTFLENTFLESITQYDIGSYQQIKYYFIEFQEELFHDFRLRCPSGVGLAGPVSFTMMGYFLLSNGLCLEGNQTTALLIKKICGWISQCAQSVIRLTMEVAKKTRAPKVTEDIKKKKKKEKEKQSWWDFASTHFIDK